ncbi:MAG: DUF4214 domain-containing protein [Burkholderiaceae bacterium]|nr:DUF4214 domain-containing protein [Burkholderiaceae bacterium]
MAALIDDTIRGGAGNDTLHGYAGDDTIYGDAGDDSLYGDDGNDYVSGDAGNDILFGGSGNDSLYGGLGNDIFYGDVGRDTLSGDAGDDQLFGGADDDILLGGAGKDILRGDAGNDTLFGEVGDDTLYGGLGNDTLSGGAGNDSVYGDEGADVVSGNEGNDLIYGGLGNDLLYGDIGNDTLLGGEGNDTVDGSIGDDVLYGDAGNDTLLGDVGNDTLLGGDGNDTLVGGEGENVLYGNDGNDVLSGGTSNDKFFGGQGLDTVLLPGGRSSYTWTKTTYGWTLSSKTDGFDLLQDVEILQFSGGDYELLDTSVSLGGASNDVLYGRSGDTRFFGGAGVDTVVLKGSYASYTLTKTTYGWTISSAIEGNDTLQDIERLQFADKKIALDIEGNGGQAYRLYQAAFGRAPDKPGLSHWMAYLDAGHTITEVATEFTKSAEFIGLYPSKPTNTQLVTQFYANVLHRDPDAAGLAYHVGGLDTGRTTVSQVLVDFSESTENQANLIGVIGNGFDYTS